MDTNMTFRIDSQVKAQMAAICEQLGITPPEDYTAIPEE